MSDTSYGPDPNSQYGYDQSAQYGSDDGQQGQGQWNFDWSQYPSIARVLQSQGDADTWLASVGVDTSQMNQAEA